MAVKEITLPLFGKVKLEQTDWEYQYLGSLSEYEFGELLVDIDVNFQQINDTNIKKVSQVLNDLEKISQLGSDFLAQDFEAEGETKRYINEWDQDIFDQIFTDEELEVFIQNTDNSKSKQERFLSLLRLVRVGVYAEGDDDFLVLDYAFGRDYDKGFRDDMLVLYMDKDYKVCEVSTEG